MKTAICSMLIAAFIVAPAPAQEPRGDPGSSPAHAFDFWIGDWDIRQQILRADGTWLELPAQTSVTPALDGQALIEHWQGTVEFFWEGMGTPEAMKGLSVRAYDPKTRRWYIHWMDTRSPRFQDPYVGTIADGHGEFFRKWETPEGKRVGRITFSQATPDSVTWMLAVSRDEGRTWQDIWKMAMRRRP